MRSVCVFLGSTPGHNPAFGAAAEALGREIARRGLATVYGGSNTGLMKRLADGALAEGGPVHGVSVGGLKDLEIQHQGLTTLEVVATMHARKARMAELADAFIAFPGGIGTFEEFFEVFTWARLGLHTKPCGVLNIEGYYDPLLELLDHAEREGFVRPIDQALLVRATTPEDMLDGLQKRWDGR